MKKYNLITLVMGIMVSCFIFYLGLLGIKWFVIISLIPVANFALSVFSRKINGTPKKLISELFIFFSIIINISFLSALTFCVINLPPEKAFEAGIKLDPYDSKGEKAFEQLQPLFVEFNKNKLNSNTLKKYIGSDIPIDSGSLEFLSKTKAARKSIIDILSTNTLYMKSPERYDTPESNKVLSLFDNELAEIKYMFKQGQNESALEKYRLLWNSSINLFDYKNPWLVNSLIAKGSLNRLIDFYNKNKGFFPKNYFKDLNFNADKLIKKLEDSIERGFNNEYLASVYFIKLSNYRWPLLDYNKTTKEIYSRYEKMIKESKLNSSPSDQKNENDYTYRLTVENCLFNPVGNWYIANTAMFDGIIDNVIETKNEIKMFAEEVGTVQ